MYETKQKAIPDQWLFCNIQSRTIFLLQFLSKKLHLQVISGFIPEKGRISTKIDNMSQRGH